MEARLTLLFEFLGEALLQIFGELLVEIGLRTVKEPFVDEPNPWIAAAGHLMLGAIVGGLSLLAAPHHLTPVGARRLLNVAPVRFTFAD